MGKIEEEFFKNLSDSKHIDLLIKEKVDKSVAEISQKYQKYIRILIGLGIFILTFFGYESVNILGKIESLDNHIENIKNIKTSLNTENDLMIRDIKLQIKDIDVTKKTINIKSKQALNEISLKQKEIDDWFVSKYKNKLSDIDKSLKRYSFFENKLQTDLSDITKLKYSLSGQIQVIENDIKKIRKNSSVRYIFVDRGDRNITDQFYRGEIRVLPFTEDTLEIIFWGDPISLEDPKEISLDIVHNGERTSHNFKEKDTYNFVTKNNLNYVLESVFIYLPPNAKTILGGIGPYYKMPDFVIIKVFLK